MLIVDGFLRDPQPLMRYAADKAQFQRATDYYPGVRAPCPSAYTDIAGDFRRASGAGGHAQQRTGSLYALADGRGRRGYRAGLHPLRLRYRCRSRASAGPLSGRAGSLDARGHPNLRQGLEAFRRPQDRRNIVVIADEAHRSQYDFIDGFARHLHDALPHASFIGFTGTPIEAQDRNTPAVFGDYQDRPARTL